MRYRFKFNGIIELEGDFESFPEDLKSVLSASSLTFLPEISDEADLQNPNLTEFPHESGFIPYFKYLDSLTYHGKIIKSSLPVFTDEDLGKEFCGLFAHLNPDTPVDDLYWPGILGSRYATVINVVSSYEIQTDFEFSGQSSFGYLFHDNSEQFYAALTRGGIINLPKGTLVIPQLRRTDLMRDTFLIGHQEGSDLMFGYEDYFPYAVHKRRRFDTTLFDFDDRSINFASINVNFLPPFRIIKCTEPHFPRLFANSRKAKQKLRVAMVNCDTTLNQKNNQCNSFGFGLGVIYDSDNLFYLKNFKNRGGSFTDFKVPDGGRLWLIMDNVQLDFKNKNEFQSSAFPCRLSFGTHRQTLPYHVSYPQEIAETSDSSFYFFLNQYYSRGWNNFFNILHVDRFVFYLPTAQYFKNIHDPLFGGFEKWQISDVITQTMTSSKIMIFQIPKKGKTYWVQRSGPDTVRTFVNWSQVQQTNVHHVNAPSNGQPVELQPGDIFELLGQVYKVLVKERGDYPNMPEGYRNFNRAEESQYIFCNCKLDKILPDGEIFEIKMIHSCSEYLLDGKPRPAYFIYKGNSQIALTESTRFGDAQVLYSAGLGHLSYNHKEIGLWARNTNHNGFYRQSSGNGKSPGYTLINSTGFGNEFNPDEEVNQDGSLPQECLDYLDYLNDIGLEIQ